jgi:hypothetical protein
MPVPTIDDVRAYLSSSGLSGWAGDEVEAALAAEKAAQARACVVPEDDEDDWPPELSEALRRRVARNLSLRRRPMGLEISEMGATRITGRDVEIARLESGHRKWVVA